MAPSLNGSEVSEISQVLLPPRVRGGQLIDFIKAWIETEDQREQSDPGARQQSRADPVLESGRGIPLAPGRGSGDPKLASPHALKVTGMAPCGSVAAAGASVNLGQPAGWRWRGAGDNPGQPRHTWGAGSGGGGRQASPKLPHAIELRPPTLAANPLFVAGRFSPSARRPASG